MHKQVNDFNSILERAAKRKGGLDALYLLLPEAVASNKVIAEPDSYFLQEMTRSIFQSGFVWKVINNKWPAFQQAFLDFEPARLMKLSDEQWEDYIHDKRIVRHRQKVKALRHNLWFVNEISAQYQGFGRFLVEWPKTDLVGLFRLLKQKGSRLGGNTGQYFLQHVGVDSFALTRDVVTALQLYGLDIRDTPNSLKDLEKIQQTFNDWHEQTGLPYYHLSMVLAYSVGENRVQSELVN